MADRFWVGGTGTWNSTSTANWSASSGGAPGASAPTSADDVFFDANSGTGTCTTDATAICHHMTMNSATLGLTLGANFTAAGSPVWTLTQGVVNINDYVLTVGAVVFTGATARTLAFGANTGKIVVTLGNVIVINATNVTNLTITGTKRFECTYSGATGTRTIRGPQSAPEARLFDVFITAGTDTVALAITATPRLYRTLNFDGFSGTLANWPVTIYGDYKLNSSMTLTAGTYATTFAATSGTKQITTSGLTLDFPLTFNGIGGTFAFQDALTQGSANAFTVINGTVQLKNGVTSTVGAFVTSGTNQKFLQSTLAGSQATLSQASGTVSASYLTIKDINATGGATWNAFVTNGNVDAGNNTGWDFFVQLGKYIYTRRKNKRILL